MSTVRILESVPRSQASSPFFNHLPLDIRLIIYAFVFMGCRATVWFDGEWSDVGKRGKGLNQDWPILVRDGLSCYEHLGGGFSLLNTCRQAYIESFSTYWSHTVLQMMRNITPQFQGCEVQQVCAYLPVKIKENLRHIRHVILPLIENGRPACGDPNWTPTLLSQFPKLVSCALSHVWMMGVAEAAGGLGKANLLRVTDGEQDAMAYFDLAPFWVKTGESPAAFLERVTGVPRSCGVMILSKANAKLPHDLTPGPAYQGSYWPYYNWVTGMVYQTTEVIDSDEPGFEAVMRAEEGSDWSRCWYLAQFIGPEEAAYAGFI